MPAGMPPRAQRRRDRRRRRSPWRHRAARRRRAPGTSADQAAQPARRQSRGVGGEHAGSTEREAQHVACRGAERHADAELCALSPAHAAEDLLEVIMRRYERAATLPTSSGPMDDRGSCSTTPPRSTRSSTVVSAVAPLTRRAPLGRTVLKIPINGPSPQPARGWAPYALRNLATPVSSAATRMASSKQLPPWNCRPHQRQALSG